LSKPRIEDPIDLLEQQLGQEAWFRLVPVAASLPRVAEPAPPPEAAAAEQEKQKAERISREELYANIQAMARLNRVYLGMVVLSTVVAAAGLLNNNVAVIIGAMVLALFLSPIILSSER
jgi:hypothetical protein